MHSHPAYALMVAIAVKAGRPTVFPNDLYVHDSRTLDKALAQTMAHYCGQTSMLFHWDGSELVEITETKLMYLLMGRKVSTDRQALSY